MELICRSRGGNPPAQLIWYKNGEQIRMAYRTAGRLSENIYTFTADTTDNKAKYRCDASNVMSPSPLKAEVTLTVLCKSEILNCFLLKLNPLFEIIAFTQNTTLKTVLNWFFLEFEILFFKA